MTKVFVGGSRAVSRLNSRVKERLDNIMKQNFMVLVGDANGADKAVQRYLADRHYGNVLVYSMDVCRNNVGDWSTRKHTAESSTMRDRRYYGVKDLAMAGDANCGFMLWDGRSKGTLTNVINLLNAEKKVLLYLSPKKLFFTLRTLDDLPGTLHASGVDDVGRFLSTLQVRQPLSRDIQSAQLG